MFGEILTILWKHLDNVYINNYLRNDCSYMLWNSFAKLYRSTIYRGLTPMLLVSGN